MLLGAGGALYSRMGKLDSRIDHLEVVIAKEYVSKDDFVRMEDKLDAILMSQGIYCQKSMETHND